MNEFVNLRAADDFELSAYVAKPAGEPLAGLVVIQEIFGVNAHIRGVADGYARDGFLAVAPALFDRIERGVELTYDGSDLRRAMSFTPRIDFDKALLDVQAAIEYAAANSGKKAGVIGYCFGGTMAWLAATRLKPSVAVGYYGGRIASYAQEQPNCPVMLHYGKDDAHIPPEQIETIRRAHPEVDIYIYAGAGHGFSCDARASYNADAAKLARDRSLKFLKRSLAIE